jgi:hypothetical protein
MMRRFLFPESSDTALWARHGRQANQRVHIIKATMTMVPVSKIITKKASMPTQIAA